MKRFLIAAFALIFAIILSGCGIKSGLKTPPPLWGDTAKDQTVGGALPTADGDTPATQDDLQDSDVDVDDDDDEDVGYGVDVADLP